MGGVISQHPNVWGAQVKFHYCYCYHWWTFIMFLVWDHCYLGSFKVLWTFLHMYFGRQKHSYLLGICPRMKILYHRVCEYWILGNMDSFPIILHHPCVRVPVAPHACKNLSAVTCIFSVTCIISSYFNFSHLAWV